MAEFLYICEYFGISPKEFFDVENSNPTLLREVIKDLSSLEEKQVNSLHEIIKGLKK